MPGSNFASNDKIDRYNAAAKAAVEQAGYGFIDVTTHLRNDTAASTRIAAAVTASTSTSSAIIPC